MFTEIYIKNIKNNPLEFNSEYRKNKEVQRQLLKEAEKAISKIKILVPRDFKLRVSEKLQEYKKDSFYSIDPRENRILRLINNFPNHNLLKISPEFFKFFVDFAGSEITNNQNSSYDDLGSLSAFEAYNSSSEKWFFASRIKYFYNIGSDRANNDNIGFPEDDYYFDEEVCDEKEEDWITFAETENYGQLWLNISGKVWFKPHDESEVYFVANSFAEFLDLIFDYDAK